MTNIIKVLSALILIVSFVKSSHYRQECSVHPFSRKNCGFPGMKISMCINMGCCYDELNRCFLPKPSKITMKNLTFSHLHYGLFSDSKQSLEENPSGSERSGQQLHIKSAKTGK